MVDLGRYTAFIFLSCKVRYMDQYKNSIDYTMECDVFLNFYYGLTFIYC